MDTPGWWGRYTDIDNPHYCKVVDVSVLGIGLELFGEVPSDLIGHRLSIEIQAPVGGSITLQLTGVVKNMTPTSDGAIRVGLEFDDLTDVERTILDAMGFMGIGW